LKASDAVTLAQKCREEKLDFDEALQVLLLQGKEEFSFDLLMAAKLAVSFSNMGQPGSRIPLPGGRRMRAKTSSKNWDWSHFSKLRGTPAGSEEAVNDPDFCVRYFHMTIAGLADRHIVAKLRRITSPPIKLGSVGNSMASALRRLADIFRLGTQSRNYADLHAMEETLSRLWNTTADEEWPAYTAVICRTLGVERLEPFPTNQPRPTEGHPPLRVVFHQATMNERPYSVARVGEVLGSPSATFLCWPHEQDSALARLRDVFKIGVHGQSFRDFVEQNRKVGRHHEELAAEWQAYEQAVLWEMRHKTHPSMLTIDDLERFVTEGR
jgi:hypothetical protein